MTRSGPGLALTLLALLALLLRPAAAQDQDAAVGPPTDPAADAILGTYINDKQTAHIEIFREEDRYFGRIVWHKEDKKDGNNPDPDLRDRPLVGIVLLRDFVYDPEEKEWADGSVYAPDDGNVYSGYLWLEDGVLKMRGYVGFPIFGRTAELTPVPATE